MKTNRLFFGILLFMLTIGLQAQQGGYSLEFDGTNDYVTFGYNASLVLTTSVSIEAWVKLNSTNTQDFVAGKIVHGGSNYGYGLYINNGNLGGVAGQITFIAGRSWFDWPSVRSISILETGKWYHIVGTFDGQYLKIYVNGALDNTYNYGALYSMNDSGDNFKIGYCQNIGNNFFDGTIDEVRVWSVARTQQEIRDNMYKEIGTHTNLKAYYQMSNGSGATLTDNSGNSNTGTISSATWAASTAPLPYYTIADGNWTTNSTWASGQNAPTSDWASVKINNAVLLNSGEGKTVNDLNVAEGGALTINSGASIITNGTVTNSGTFTVQKDIAESSKWHLISMPNENTTTTSFTGYYLQEWGEPTSNWVEITGLGAEMPACKGYSLYDVPGKTTFSFTGTPNTGDKSIGITYHDTDGTNDGMNLIGNPYPSAIDWDVLDNTYGAVYVWDPTTATYKNWNAGVGDVQYLAPLQGFFVYSASNTTFTIGNSARTHTGATTFYKSETNEIENGLILSTNQQDKLYIKLTEEATEDFDFSSDAYKIVSLGEGNSQLYSKYIETKLAIDCRPETEAIQLGYQNNRDGRYSIELVNSDGISNIQLEDTKLNHFHNLSSGAYTFDWNTTDSEERFILHLKATGTADLEAQAAQVYAANQRVYVRLSELDSYSEMAVYDLRGRLIIKKTLSASSLQSFELNQPSGAYLVQLIGESGTESFKIVL